MQACEPQLQRKQKTEDNNDRSCKVLVLDTLELLRVGFSNLCHSSVLRRGKSTEKWERFKGLPITVMVFELIEVSLG